MLLFSLKLFGFRVCSLHFHHSNIMHVLLANKISLNFNLLRSNEFCENLKIFITSNLFSDIDYWFLSAIALLFNILYSPV